jgi:hypothetical protein
MKLTTENKAIIDGKSYEALLSHWRFAPAGDPWFEGETGTYWMARMKEMREANPAEHTAASKRIGW